MDYQRCYFARPDGTYNHWNAFCKTWTDVFGPLPEKIDPLLEHTADGLLATRNGNTRYAFSPDAPHTLMRAFYCMGVDVNNGADGNYFDDQSYLGNGYYGAYTTANFQTWLASRHTPEQLFNLFDAGDVAALTPARAVGNRPLRSLGPADVTPLTIAFLRYRAWRQGWLREQMRTFGRTINPHFVMTSTYWSHAGSPYVPTVHMGLNIEQITQQGGRDTFLFWEPGTHGPEGGTPLAQARKLAAEGKGNVSYGRRSFAGSYKQMVGASHVPVVTKQHPAGQQSGDLTELLYAEAWANLVSVRSGLHKPFNEEAIERMHAFQAAHPGLSFQAPFPAEYSFLFLPD